jgi:hypothetical protein
MDDFKQVICFVGVAKPGGLWAVGFSIKAQSRSERVAGIEPALSAWEAEVLPLNYTRDI